MKEASHVQAVLETAQKDLNDAEWPGIIGLIANPVRGLVLRPILGVATHVLPTVASHVPLLDCLSASVLEVTFGAVKMGYTIFPHLPQMNVHAQNELVDGATRAKVAWYQEPKREVTLLQTFLSVPGYIASYSMSAITSGINTTRDLLTFPEEKFVEWQKTLDLFFGYMAQFGMEEKVMKVWLNPRTELNMVIMARILKSIDGVFSHRRNHTALKVPPLSDYEYAAHVLFKKASRFIQYSIAAYGVSYLEESTALASSNGGAPDKIVLDQAVEELEDLVRIAKYLDIDEEDIVYATPQRTELKLVGHCVALDHKTRSVVLAIRGTHITSEQKGFDAEKVPFCGGMAHKGLATCANILWENQETRNAIARSLYRYDGYQLVITGHSLGAGVANLVHIRCHYVNLFSGKKSVCFAFSSPPVFSYTFASPSVFSSWSPSAKTVNQQSIIEAFASCHNFINGMDQAPFLSADAVDKLVDTLEKVDRITCDMSDVDRFMLARGAKEPSDALVQIVRQGCKLLEPDADRLKIPGDFIVWFKETLDEYDTLYCDPIKISELNIFVDIKMAHDHFPKSYETALEILAESEY